MPNLLLSTGRRLAYEHFGDPKGVPAFYFHGWPSSKVQGAVMDAPGKKLGLHVVAMDRPGIGGSDVQEGRCLLDWPPVLRELADHLNWPSFHLFGVSGGGPYALVTAHQMPERVLSVSVICGAPPLRELGTRELFWAYRFVLQVRKRAPWLLPPLFMAGVAASRLPPGRWPMSWALRVLNKRDRAVLQDPVLGPVVTQGFRESVLSGVPKVRADGDIYTSDWGFNPRDISVPVHFWHGKADRNIPWTYARKLAAMVPLATTHWTEDDGHYSMAVSRAEEIARVAIGVERSDLLCGEIPAC